MVDYEDYPSLNQYKWTGCGFGNWRYAARRIAVNKREYMVIMHRIIMHAPVGLEVDHRNHNTFDNRKINLRLVSASQNQFNRILSDKNTSGYLGITWDKKNQAWSVRIGYLTVPTYFGIYKNKEDAIAIRKQAERDRDKAAAGVVGQGDTFRRTFKLIDLIKSKK